MTNSQKKTVLAHATQVVAFSEAVAKIRCEIEALNGKVRLDAFGNGLDIPDEELRLMDGAGERLMHAENLLLEVNDFLCAAIGESAAQKS